MAAIWKGSLTFGLVNIPVELKTAVRADHISFRLLHERDFSPVKYERICQAEGRPVPWNEIVKGYEYEKGKFVVPDRISRRPRSDKTIDILDFVKEKKRPPLYFETPYYLVPGKGGQTVRTPARSHSPNWVRRDRQNHHSPDTAPRWRKVVGRSTGDNAICQ